MDFILELVQNLYCGDSPYGPDTREYKICCGLLNVIDAFLNTIHFSIGKVLKGATSVRGLVEPLLWNPGPCDANATLPCILCTMMRTRRRKGRKPAFDDPVRPAKGPAGAGDPGAAGDFGAGDPRWSDRLVIWAVVAIVHAATTGCIGALPFIF